MAEWNQGSSQPDLEGTWFQSFRRKKLSPVPPAWASGQTNLQRIPIQCVNPSLFQSSWERHLTVRQVVKAGEGFEHYYGELGKIMPCLVQKDSKAFHNSKVRAPIFPSSSRKAHAHFAHGRWQLTATGGLFQETAKSPPHLSALA